MMLWATIKSGRKIFDEVPSGLLASRGVPYASAYHTYRHTPMGLTYPIRGAGNVITNPRIEECRPGIAVLGILPDTSTAQIVVLWLV